ncbi:MAG: glucose-6-phosphate isomerase [Alphaproteobacteria bacterium]|nr:glucose-6-phosphate isomerase [Alphaproteobacteria bacterium]
MVKQDDVAAAGRRLADKPILALFGDDPGRADTLCFSAPHLILDLSKQRVDVDALRALAARAQARGFDAKRTALFSGAIVNATEGRAALHPSLRGVGPQDAVREAEGVRARVRTFAGRIRAGALTGATGAAIDQIVHIGIGGSDLGPRLLFDALKPFRTRGITLRFASNIDGADIFDALEGLDPARTLIVVASKTFTTLETRANAETARAWLKQGLGDAISPHLAAVTAAPARAGAWGVDDAHIFPFSEAIGGRYSVWSAVSLACDAALQEGAFDRFLAGGGAMDAHFRDAPFLENLPALAAALQTWNREILGAASYACVPYATRLEKLPAYLQQLEMESNGKGVDENGAALEASAAGVTWGAAGANAQHSFFQLLHQGVEKIPVEFVVQMHGLEGPPERRAALHANALAQAEALLIGKSAEEAYAEMIAAGMDAARAEALAPHRAFSGDRSSTLLGLEDLSPESFGALLAFYEHRTVAQAWMSGINPFDQWGVELGKALAKRLQAVLEGEDAPPLDASTRAWVERLRERRTS